jgi:hypothetical protein
MMRLRGSCALLLVTFVITCGRASAPAQARVLMNIAVTSSGLVVHGIPLPAGAEPSMAANLSLENLQAMTPVGRDLGKGRLRAVIYEMQGAAPPDVVAAFYRREMPQPFALALPRRISQSTRSAPDDGIRVLPFLSLRGYLAIQSEEVSRPSRVTVAVVEGSALPVTVLKSVEALRKGGDGPVPVQAPPLLAPGAWEADFSLVGPRVQLLQRKLTPSDAPGPVVDVMRALLSQARSLNCKSRRSTEVIPASVILSQFRDEARRSNWRLLSVDAEASREVMALYRFADDKGMVMLRAGPGQPANVAPPSAPVQELRNTTEITRLEVTGAIDLRALFRPIAAVPPALTSPALGPFPSGPFSAHPR